MVTAAVGQHAEGEAQPVVHLDDRVIRAPTRVTLWKVVVVVLAACLAGALLTPTNVSERAGLHWQESHG